MLLKLSVVILNYNVRYFLELCIDSVQKALKTVEGEIIVVDNASTDGSAQMMRERFPHIRFIQNKENTGFSKGNNVGVAEALGEYVCILNPDTVVAEDTFVKMLECIEKKQDAGIVSCKFIDGTGHFLPECKRGVPTPWVALTKIFGLYQWFPKSKWFNQYYAMHLQPGRSGEVSILSGACMMMKRQLYLDVGGFDENCFMYSDDIDLSYTVMKSGKKNYYCADTTIIHFKGESTVKDGTYMKRFREAMEFFYHKHFRPSFFFSFFMWTGAWFFALFKRSQKGKPASSPLHYRIYTQDHIFVDEIRKHFQKSIEQVSDFHENDVISQAFSTELIFDSAALSYAEIIEVMERYAGKGYTFKIRPDGCWYILGSHSSDSRGEILKIS